MDLDVWHYVSVGKGTPSQHRGFTLFNIGDMRLLQLPENWWYYLDNLGDGQAIDPPFKVRPFISWTPSTNILIAGKLKPSPKMPQEKLCIDINKRRCNLENLF